MVIVNKMFLDLMGVLFSGIRKVVAMDSHFVLIQYDRAIRLVGLVLDFVQKCPSA